MPHPRSFPAFALGLLLLVTLSLAACSRDRALQPRQGSGLQLKIRTAPRGTAEPAPGPVDTIRVVARDAGGGLLSSLDIPIATGQQTFNAALDVPAGTERIITVMALGQRRLSGDGEVRPPTDRGILFYDRVDNVSVSPGQPTPLTITLRGFVARLEEPQVFAGQGHRVRWRRVPGATSYQLLRYFDGGLTTQTLIDTVFEAEGLPSSYAVRALELGGGAGALSDYATLDRPLAPTVPTGLATAGASATQIDLSWNASTGPGPITYDVERRVDPSATFAGMATDLTATTASDTDVSGSQTYFYHVRAVGPGGASDWSSEVAGVGLPGAPSGLTAVASSPTRVTLAWTRGTGRVDGYDIQRRVPPGAFAVLPGSPADVTTVDDATVAASTTYEYRVVPRNLSGSGPGSNTAGVTTPSLAPNAPSNLSAHAFSPTQVDLTWTDNSTNETGFEVQRAVGTSDTFVPLEPTAANVTSLFDRGVTEATGYRYRVRARLDQLASDWSTEVSVTTPATRPGSPSALVAQALSRTSIRLTWIDNATNETSLRLEFEEPPGTWNSVTGLPANTTTYDATGLQPQTTYTYRVFALNAGGDSDPSNTASATTLTEVPTAPSNLAAVAQDYNRVHLTWADNSDNETSFDILRQAGATQPVHFSASADQTSFDDTGVVASTTYSYSVRAVRNQLNSAFAGPVQVTTPPGPPSVPQNLVATAMGSSQIRLTWEASTGTLTGYVLEHRGPGAAGFTDLVTLSPSSLSFIHSNLQPHSTHTYRVRSRNTFRDSEPGNEASATTDQTLPAPPSALAGVALVGGTSIQLGWTDNASNETGFRVEARINTTPAFATVATPAVDVEAATITGLIPDTNYDFRVFATNELGDSSPSSVILVKTRKALPSTPINFNASATSSTRIDLTWQPGPGGGLPTGYSIERRQAPVTSFTQLASPSGSQLDFGDIGLLPDTRYDYRMRALNSEGFSAYSDTVSAMTPIEPPGPPGGLFGNPVAQSSTAVDITWNAPSTGGAPAFYDVRHRTLGANIFGPVTTVTAPTNTLRISGLQPSTSYEFVVVARNAGGTSGQSNIALVTTNPLPPAAPTNLDGSVDSDSVLHLTWDDNSTNETEFELQRALDAPVLSWSVLVILDPNTESYGDGGSVNSIYHYRILARNGGGDSNFSNELIVDFSLSAPGSFLPNPLASDLIRLEWYDYNSDEVGYEIQQGTPVGGGFNWSPLNTTGAFAGQGFYAVTGVNSVTTYYFRIRTVGPAGHFSNWVGPLPAKTAGTLPTAPSGLGYSFNEQTNVLTLFWTDNSINEARFDIYKAVNDGTLAPAGTAGINAPSYYDTSLDHGQPYHFRVGATNALGTQWSAILDVFIPLGP